MHGIRVWRLAVGFMLLLAPQVAVAAGAGGLVVEAVKAGKAGEQAGIAAGDVLLGWSREPTLPAGHLPAAGLFASPFDLNDAELEQGPRGDLHLRWQRGGAEHDAVMPSGPWGLTVRPRFAGVELSWYLTGEERSQQDLDAGLLLWQKLAQRLERTGKVETAAWLWLRVAERRTEQQGWEEAQDALAQARRTAETARDQRLLAEVVLARGDLANRRDLLALAQEAYTEALELQLALAPDSARPARTLSDLGILSAKMGDIDTAETLFRRALAIAERLTPDGPAVNAVLNNLGIVARRRGDLERAEELLRRTLVLTQRQAPDSVDLAITLLNLGALARERGDLDATESYHRQAVELCERLAPDSPELANSLYNLSYPAYARGKLAEAEKLQRRALDIEERRNPDSLAVARTLSSLGAIAFDRGELDTAESYHRRSLSIYQRLAPASEEVAISLNNLGGVAQERGDLEQAESYLLQSMALYETNKPDSISLATSFNNLGDVAELRGDLDRAAAFQRRALEIQEGAAPGSLYVADSRYRLGRIAQRRGDLATAAEQLGQALAIRARLAPGSSVEAEACYQLADLRRQERRFDEALGLYQRAVAALEAQERQLGGSDEARIAFGAGHDRYYQDYLGLLLELDRGEEAFAVLERYRARSFLALLAARDLTFAADLPAELEAQREQSVARHDRLYRELVTLDVAASRRREALLRELRDSQRQRDEVVARIRTTSPRLAALRYPQPLDLAATRKALDPGTLLLSYAVGAERGYLFALGPDGGELRVLPLAGEAATLRTEIERFREALRQGHVDPRQQRVLFHARRLSERLLAPAREQIARAERLLILPDGPLHLLPFAALTDPTSADPHRYLATAKPVHVAASATVFARLKAERRPARTPLLVAFGDPVYPAAAQPDSLRGAGLTPLPATRGEVESLGRLFPRASQLFLGPQATEMRAKALNRDATLVHFACHGWLDDRSPFDSALALTIPEAWQEGEDNGLLQVWEVFEQVRIDADLVTLSACDTALGREAAGEGLLGLSRAFQYAGARSVLASLWRVDDRSTAELMRRFYGYLRAGHTKAEALHRAQADLQVDPAWAHPFHWAGFQLIGDDR